MIKNIIFDFDGTLADTQEGILATEREMLRRMGLPEPDQEQMCSAIGLPLPESLRRGCAIPEERVDEAVKLYRDLFFDYAPQHIVIFEGVKEALAELAARGIRMAIATSRSSNSLAAILETHKMADFFPERVTADCGIQAKPAPDMVLHLLKKMGISPAETLVVGDTTFDLLMGKGAGCLAAGVSYGNHSREMLATAHPDWILDRFPDLMLLLDKA
jgi:phosphoglycolate phosphatase